MNGRHLAGSFLRQIVPAAQLNAVLGLEFDVLAHGHIFLPHTVAVRPWRPCRGAASRNSMAPLPTTAMKSHRLTGLPLGRGGTLTCPGALLHATAAVQNP